MPRIVVDLGNSRLKWALLDEAGVLGSTVSMPLDDPTRWAVVYDVWHRRLPGPSVWAVSTVNPPLAERLEKFLAERRPAEVRWFRTAADAPIPKDVEGAETGGSDRALAALGALKLLGVGRPILVVMCGTAITVERVTAAGVWQGGAIAMGLGLCARALHDYTAQLPLIEDLGPESPSWGRGTEDSLTAGVFWGTVGAVRELLKRQEADLDGPPRIVWAGGDTSLLAPAVEGPDALVVPDLVLRGLVHAAFPSEP